jgi:hypothetical protein
MKLMNHERLKPKIRLPKLATWMLAVEPPPCSYDEAT